MEMNQRNRPVTGLQSARPVDFVTLISFLCDASAIAEDRETAGRFEARAFLWKRWLSSAFRLRKAARCLSSSDRRSRLDYGRVLLNESEFLLNFTDWPTGAWDA